MPIQTVINAYKKLFGVTDNEQARNGIEEHLHAISQIREKAFARKGEDHHLVFQAGYFNFCEEKVKIAWTKNLVQRLSGVDLDRNTAQITDEFSDYMRGLNALLMERGIEDAPNVNDIFEDGMFDEVDDEGDFVEGWLNQWKHDVLDKVPSGRMGAAQFYLYGRDLETNKEPSVKTSVNRAKDGVASICSTVSLENAAQKCTQAVATLRAVEEKHASRWLLWKIFHPIDNRREKKAIEVMREQIGQTFSPEQIAAAQAQSNAEMDWIIAEKGDSFQPSKGNEMKVNPLESEGDTRRRVAEEMEQTAREKEELARIAEELKPVAELDSFMQGAEEADKMEELMAKGDEDYREFTGDTFEKSLDEEATTFKAEEDEKDIADDFAEMKESLFVSEAEEDRKEEKSQPSFEKDAPDLAKNIK